MSRTDYPTRWKLGCLAMGTGTTGILGVILLPMMAMAHVQGGAGGGILTGFHHPITGLDHVLAMMAVGMWGAQLGSPCIWALPVAFPMIMALGGALGILDVQIPGVEPAITVTVIILGTLIALAARPQVFIAITLVSIFAIFHGYAHGAELPAGADALTYSLGFVVATGLLHLTGILIGLVVELPGGYRLLRVAGGLIAGAGVCLFVAMVTG